MKRPESVIIKPYLTEKTNFDSTEGKYTFKVMKTATKTEIRMAVEALFNVRVLNVNTLNVRGKKKRMGVHVGYKPNWKKAIVKVDSDPSANTYMEKGAKEISTGRKYNKEIQDYGATN